MFKYTVDYLVNQIEMKARQIKTRCCRLSYETVKLKSIRVYLTIKKSKHLSLILIKYYYYDMRNVLLM